jgi:RND family efflux transporter MFP subunit
MILSKCRRSWNRWAMAGCFLLCFADAVFARSYPAVVEAEETAVLAAEREGMLTRLSVDVGDRVEKGAVVGTVFHRHLTLSREKLDATGKYFETLAENLERLNARGMAADDELAKAKMDVVVNRKEIEMIELEIQRSRIVSPFSGLVVERHVQPHEWVRPGQPVVELYNPAELRIVADLPADLAFGLKKGDSRTIRFPDIDRTIEARLTVFSPRVDVRSNTIKVYWALDARESRRIGLKPGVKGVLEIDHE